MRTWDFFDTLLGRACGEPWRVFELVGGLEFKKLRQAAEQRSDKTFAGIYKTLQKMTKWSDEKITRLAKSELAWERKLAFPIVDNVARVTPADTIITDTYFDAAQIRELAALIGVPECGVHASYGDKYNGQIWARFKAQKTAITQHVGDNPHSDYTMPRKYGISAARFTAGNFTPFEKTLQRSNCWDVAGLARCVRLQNQYDKQSLQWPAYHKQAAYNIPFLLCVAARLKQYVTTNAIAHVYFVTRDAVLIHRVFSHLYPNISTSLFYASRQTYRAPSASYIDYAQHCAKKPRALFVDLQGTGESAAYFQKQQNIKLHYLFCAAPLNLKIYAPALYRIKSDGTELEVFNYDVNGRVIDVVNGVPIRDKVEYDVRLVEAGHAAVTCLLRHIFQPPAVPGDAIMQQVFQQNRNALLALVKQHVVTHTHIERT